MGVIGEQVGTSAKAIPTIDHRSVLLIIIIFVLLSTTGLLLAGGYRNKRGYMQRNKRGIRTLSTSPLGLLFQSQSL